MIIAEISTFPIGEGTSLSKYVKAAIKALMDSGVKVIPGAMSTVIEAETLDEIFNATKMAHEAILKMGAKRVATSLRIDDRRDVEATAEKKLKAIKIT
ncbi:MAG: MTH1187 family thiamine-binding protein [Candidatus Jordarchaeaceae archaeon]